MSENNIFLNKEKNNLKNITSLDCHLLGNIIHNSNLIAF